MNRLQISSADGFQVIAGTARSQAATMVLGPGESVGGAANRHPSADQWLFVLSGSGSATVEGRDVALAGDRKLPLIGLLLRVILIRDRNRHRLVQDGDYDDAYDHDQE